MKTDTDSQQKVLLYQLNYVLQKIQPQYFEHLIDCLKESLEHNTILEIQKETNQLISCCSSMGWSNEALHDLIKILHGSKTDVTKWDNFKNKLCSSTFEEYHILLPFKVRAIAVPGQNNMSAKERVLDEISHMGIEILASADIKNQYSYLNQIEPNQKYLLAKVYARDVYAASHSAISKIANALNILSFYRLTEPWNIRDISWLAVNTSNEYVKLFKSKDLYSTYDYLEGAYKIFSASKELDRNAEQSLRTKLQATYSYANMGKVSYAQTEKFMNTWVALESLCRTDMYENIIENVLQTVPPALCLRYIYRCFRNFVEDCRRCDIDFQFSNISIDLRQTSKEKLVEEIITVLNDRVVYQELLDKCKINKLLLQRCNEMHLIATNANEMFQKIDSHYTNVRRHLSRLYRLRNEIAHSALNDGTSLIRYIEHLDDYLSDFVAEVVMCWSKNPQSSIENIFEIIKDNYQAYTDIKNSKKEANPIALLDSLRKTGIIALV